jgi:hypothetical protein
MADGIGIARFSVDPGDTIVTHIGASAMVSSYREWGAERVDDLLARLWVELLSGDAKLRRGRSTMGI